jgi:hypothetical protein
MPQSLGHGPHESPQLAVAHFPDELMASLFGASYSNCDSNASAPEDEDTQGPSQESPEAAPILMSFPLPQPLTEHPQLPFGFGFQASAPSPEQLESETSSSSSVEPDGTTNWARIQAAGRPSDPFRLLLPHHTSSAITGGWTERLSPSTLLHPSVEGVKSGGDETPLELVANGTLAGGVRIRLDNAESPRQVDPEQFAAAVQATSNLEVAKQKALKPADQIADHPSELSKMTGSSERQPLSERDHSGSRPEILADKDPQLKSIVESQSPEMHGDRSNPGAQPTAQDPAFPIAASQPRPALSHSALQGQANSKTRIRQAEPIQLHTAEPPSRTVDRIDLFVSGPDQERVEVQVVERRGELHVSLRATGAENVERIRESLPELANRLNGSGFDAGIWRPDAADVREPIPAGAPVANEMSSDDGAYRDHERQQQEERPKPNDDEESFIEMITGEDHK